MKENFTPWGYYWEVLLSFTQFSAISFAAFKMMNPRPACGFTDISIMHSYSVTSM